MKKQTRFAVLAAAVAVGTMFSSDSTAFVLSGPKWAATSVPYYINTANMDLPGSSLEAAVRFGADTWPTQAGVGFRFSFAGLSSQTTNTNDGVNLVVFRNASGGSPSTIATTYWWSTGPSGSSRIIDADIIFWDASFRFFAGTSGCSGGMFIEDVAAHEFGHALGLSHSASAGATMYPSISSCSQASRTLDADDIAGVRALYPPAPQGPTAPTGFRIVS